MKIFGYLWSLIAGGNWTEWLALGVVVLGLLGATFGAGYLTATRHDLKIAVAATAPAVAAQAKHDKVEHVAAQTKSNEVKAADASHDAKTTKIMQQIVTAAQAPQNSCEVSPDLIKLLNQAGHY